MDENSYRIMGIFIMTLVIFSGQIQIIDAFGNDDYREGSNLDGTNLVMDSSINLFGSSANDLGGDGDTETTNLNGGIDTEVFAVYYDEDIYISEDGKTSVNLSILLPESRYSDRYRMALGISEKSNLDEKISLPENPLEMDKDGLIISAPRKNFYNSISAEHWFLLGIYLDIKNSEATLHQDGGFTVDLVADGFLNIRTFEEDERSINFGPLATDDIDSATTFISSIVGFSKLLLHNFSGDQVWKRIWTSRIHFPENSTFLNVDELDGKQWILNFGGGTYFSASLSIDGLIITLNESLIVTESKKVNPAPLSHYKSFTVEYLLPNSPPLSGASDFKSLSDKFSPDTLWDGSIISFQAWWDKEWNTTLYNSTNAEVDVWIHGNLSFGGGIDAHIGLDSVWVKPHVTATGLFEAGFTGEISNDSSWEFMKPMHHWFHFFLGPVWVALDVNIRGELTLHFEAWGEINVTTEAWCYASLKAGAKWSFWSGFKTIWEPNFDYDYTEPQVKWKAGLLSEVRVGFPISALVYGVIGPEVDPGVYFEGAFIVTGSQGDVTQFDWGLELGIDIYVGVRIGIPYFWYHSWTWRIAYFPIIQWGRVSPTIVDEIPPMTRLWSYSPPVRDYHDIMPGNYWWEGKNWTGPFTPYWFAAKDTAQEGAIPQGVDKTKYKVDINWESGGSSSSDWKELSYTGVPSCYNISLSNLYGSNSYPIGYHDITITAYSIDKANNQENPPKIRHLKTDTYAPTSFIEAPSEIRAYITPIYIKATDMSPHSGAPFIGSGIDIYYRVYHEGTWSSWMSLRRDPDAEFDHPINHETGDYNWSFDYLESYPNEDYSTLKFKLYEEGENVVQFYAIDGAGNREENHTVTYVVHPPMERHHYNFSNRDPDWTELIPSGTRGNVTFTLPDGAKQCSDIFAVVNITYAKDLANMSHRLNVELYNVDTHSWKRKNIQENRDAVQFPRGDRSDHEIIFSIPHPENWNVDKIRFVTSDPNSFTNVTGGYFYYYIPGTVRLCYKYPCTFAGEDKTPVPTGKFDLLKDDYVGFYIEIKGDLQYDTFKYQLIFNDECIAKGDLGTVSENIDEIEFKPSWDMSTFGTTGTGYLKILWIDDDNPGAGEQFLGVTETFELSIDVSRERCFEIGEPKYPPDTGLWITSHTEISCPYPPPENWTGWRVVVVNPIDEEEYWDEIFTAPFSFTLNRERDNVIYLYKTHPEKADEIYCDGELHYVDDTPPISLSHLGQPYYTNGVNEWISSDTEITLSARDGPIGCAVGINGIHFRYAPGGYSRYSNPFTIPTECKHNLQYYSEDHLGNTESTNTRPLYVDNTPPKTVSSFGMPYWSDGITEWITPWTPIYLDITDYPSCSPSGIKELHYDFSGDSRPEQVVYVHNQVGHTEMYHFEFTLLDLIRPSDKYWGPQTITWYAVDNLGHKEPIKTRQIKVVIPLHLEPEQWFLDGAHQTHPGYAISSAPEPKPKEGHTCLKWTIHVDKNDPYSGLLPPNGFVDIYYNNQGMDWSKVESIDALIYTTSDQTTRNCNKSDRTKIYEIIHNPKDVWKHDLSTDSTQVAYYDDSELLLNQWNTYYWNLPEFERDNLKSFRLHFIQNDDNYSSNQETLTVYIRGILVAGPIGLEDGTQHPLSDINANTHNFTVTDVDGDWCFEHNIQHAVNWAKEGLMITVEEGTYYENVYMFRDNVTLQDGPIPIIDGQYLDSNPIIDGRYLGPTISLMANHLTIDGFDIIHGLNGIYAPGTSYHIIRSCDIYDNQDNGIYMSSSNNHNLENNDIHHNTNDGFYADSVSDTTIDNCKVYSNNIDGIYLDNSRNYDIINCNIYDNSNNGVHGDFVSNLVMQMLDIDNNGADGVHLSDSSDIKTQNSQIYQNSDDGIDTRGTSDTCIEDSLIYDNGDNGVYIGNSRNHILNNTEIYSNGNNGVSGDFVSNITMNTCKVYDNGYNGIYLYNSDNNSFLNTYVYNNSANGLKSDILSYTMGSSCNFYDNMLNGISLSNSTYINFDAMGVYDNSRYGCKLVDTTLFSLFNSEIYNNGYSGGYLNNCVDCSFINDGIYDNINDGLFGVDIDHLTVENSTITNNMGNGICLYDTINSIIKNSQISENKVNLFKESEGKNYLPIDVIPLDDNISLFDTGGIGIVLRTIDEAYYGNIIDGNTITSNERQGVYLSGTRKVIPYDNIISNNTVYSNGKGRYIQGIVLAHTNYNTIEYNTIYNHKDIYSTGMGIYIFESNMNQILHNIIYGNDEQIRFDGIAGKSNIVHYNLFSDNKDVTGHPDGYTHGFLEGKGIVNYCGEMIVDARYNWWGIPNGPHAAGEDISCWSADGNGLEVIGPVEFYPWTGIDSLPLPDKFAVEIEEPIHFSASECFAYDINGTSKDFQVHWDFGDGTTSSEKEVDHIYKHAGSYNVTLEVYSIDNMFSPSQLQDKKIITIDVYLPRYPQEEKIPIMPSESIEANKTVYLTAFANSGQPPYQFIWSFSDGSPNATGRNIYHIFTRPCWVTFTVIDNLGNKKSYNITVPLHDTPLIEVDANGPYTFNTKEITRLNPTILNGTPPFLVWWNINNTSIDPVFDIHPYFIFNQPGRYTAEVNVRDTRMHTAMDTTNINIQ